MGISVTNVEEIDRRFGFVPSDAHHPADIRFVSPELERVKSEDAVASDDVDPFETSCHENSPVRIALVFATEDDGL